MKRKNIFIPFAAVLLLSVGACSDFLSTLPDNRTEVNNETAITSLLVSAYPQYAFQQLAELMTDNTADNGTAYTTDRLVEQTYLWKDITETDTDSPDGLWERGYRAIASANQALEAIATSEYPEKLAAQKGEALMCRAYGHFILVNMFCQHYSAKSSTTDLGIPYVETPEKEVIRLMERGTVKEVYDKINADIEAGLPLIDDAIYTQPKYHFNKKAACAFAARFNLYWGKYDKVIAYANDVLGSNVVGALRDYSNYNTFTTPGEIGNAYIKADLNCNLLLLATYSSWPVVHGPYDNNKRYGHNRRIIDNETFWSPGLWSGDYVYGLLYGMSQKYSFPKLSLYFEVTDQAAGIGYQHMVYTAFTTDETLLCRAEAYAMTDQYGLATNDISAWLSSHDGGATATREDINGFYSDPDREGSQWKVIHPDFTVKAGEQENFIRALLHIRRVETAHEGLRWFDVKRYGIEVTHNRAGKEDDVLKVNDPRRAIQLPQDVIEAGMTPNAR